MEASREFTLEVVDAGTVFGEVAFTPHALKDAYAEAMEPSILLAMECADVDGLKATLRSAGVEIDDGRPAPWKRFFVRDPFGNRIEIHETGGLRT